MTLDEWIINGEVGTSSKTIWSVLKGVAKGTESMGWGADHPHDPDDFKRCYLLYKQCRLTKDDLQKVADTYAWYKPFIDSWDEMVNFYEEEKAMRRCPKLYTLIEKLSDEAKIIDGWVETSKGCWKKEPEPKPIRMRF